MENHAKELAGELSLEISRREPGTPSYASHQFHQGALRVLRPHYLDDSGQVTYSVINPGGAYFSDDNYQLDMTVHADASLLLTTQSATKVYKCPQGPATQTMHVELGARSTFEYLPDQLIVYRDGAYKQSTTVDMAASAQCIMAEIVTPGWSPSGELFAFDEIVLRTKVQIKNDAGNFTPFVIDQLRLIPADDGVGLGVMEGFSHCGQLLLIDHRLTDELYDSIRALVAESDTYSGITHAGIDITVTDPESGEEITPQCIAIRSLANDTAAIGSLQLAIVDLVRAELDGREPVELHKH